ncbi:MAG: DUF4157 domain-containing protein, partial [Leptolyngbyaceae cyanobacterium bins.59]|nr:DUF4157 domain-containing protein [Leptolyngbyaceae cyanobacterium bins.59]
MTRQRTRTKKQSNSTPILSEAPESAFELRPFTEQVGKSPEASPTLGGKGLQAKLEASQQLGHHFDQISVFPQSTTDTPLPQRKRLRRKPSAATPEPDVLVSEPGDESEQEADQVADRVVNQLEHPSTSPGIPPAPSPVIRPLVQTQAMGEETTGPSELEEKIESKRGNGNSLPDPVRGSMEHSFGADFSGVKIHTDGESDQLNRSLHSRAFTTKQDIFFRQGEYQPENSDGKELLAHELTHVVQQNGSEVRSAPPKQRVQRKIMELATYKDVSGDILSGPRRRVAQVESALIQYHKAVPHDSKSTIRLTVDELQTKEAELVKLLEVVNHYLGLKNLDALRQSGTRRLQEEINTDIGKVRDSLTRRGEPSQVAHNSEETTPVLTNQPVNSNQTPPTAQSNQPVHS